MEVGSQAKGQDRCGVAAERGGLASRRRWSPGTRCTPGSCAAPSSTCRAPVPSQAASKAPDCAQEVALRGEARSPRCSGRRARRRGGLGRLTSFGNVCKCSGSLARPGTSRHAGPKSESPCRERYFPGTHATAAHSIRLRLNCPLAPPRHAAMSSAFARNLARPVLAAPSVPQTQWGVEEGTLIHTDVLPQGPYVTIGVEASPPLTPLSDFAPFDRVWCAAVHPLQLTLVWNMTGAVGATIWM